ncbi:MAG: hypothetical protein V3U84_03675 [Thiotrichaceae bacterium]
MSGNYSHTTRATGSTLTATIYNGDHVNHITNATPTGLDDYSTNVSQMQTITDPGEVGSESLATSTAGEFERIRNIIKEITGEAQWYVTPGTNLSSISSLRNLLINGGMSIAQQLTTFDSTTTPANSDDTYMLDQWILLSDGNNIVDVTQQTSGGVSGNEAYIRLDVETAQKKFGILQVIENKDLKETIGSTASLSFECKVSNATRLSDIRAVVLSWDSTADTVTSDIVSAWNAEGAIVTPVANWTAENAAANLGVTTSWVRYTITNISIDTSSAANVGVFIYQNNVATNDTVTDTVEITNVQLEAGANASAFEYRSHGEELHRAKRYYENMNNAGLASYQVCIGQCTAATTARAIISYEVEKRIAPTVTISAAGDFVLTQAGGASQDVTVFTTSAPSVSTVLGLLTVAANLAAGNATRLTDDSNGNARIKIDARL